MAIRRVPQVAGCLPASVAAVGSARQGPERGEMAAGAVMSTLPALLLVLIAQRHIVRGLTSGAVK